MEKEKGFFEKLGESLPPELLDKLIFNKTDTDKNDYNKSVLSILDEQLELQIKLTKELMDNE